MKVSIVNQYSVFLVNEPGSLKKFSKILEKEGLDIVGLSSDVRYEAAIVKFVVSGAKEPETSRIITGAGYTSIKTEALSLEVKNTVGVIAHIGEILGKKNINITNIYSTMIENAVGRIFMVVDDLEKATDVLKAVKDF